jgi:hypothetical protein
MTNRMYPTRKQRLEDFAFICKEYGLVNNNELSKDAIELKRKIIKHVEEFYSKYSENEIG